MKNGDLVEIKKHEIQGYLAKEVWLPGVVIDVSSDSFAVEYADMTKECVPFRGGKFRILDGAA